MLKSAELVLPRMGCSIIGKIFSKDFFSLLTSIKNFREKRPFCGTAFSKLRWELQE
jgi:hypothetical protein